MNHVGGVLGSQDDAVAGTRGAAGLHPINVVVAEQLVGVSDLKGQIRYTALDMYFAGSLGDIESETRFGIAIAGEPRQISSAGVGTGLALGGVQTVGIQEEGVTHPELAGEGIHVGHGVAHRIKACGVRQGTSEMVSQRNGRHIVGGQKAGIEKIAERQHIAGLETERIDPAGRSNGLLGNNSGFIQVPFLDLGPVDGHHRKRQFRQAGDRQLPVLSDALEDPPGLIIDDNRAFGAENTDHHGHKENESKRLHKVRSVAGRRNFQPPMSYGCLRNSLSATGVAKKFNMNPRCKTESMLETHLRNQRPFLSQGLDIRSFGHEQDTIPGKTLNRAHLVEQLFDFRKILDLRNNEFQLAEAGLQPLTDHIRLESGLLMTFFPRARDFSIRRRVRQLRTQ